MKKFTDLRIKGITWNQRSIQITWHSVSAEMEAESCLYQHSDGTWSVDPFSKSLGSSFGEKLLSELMKSFISQTFPYDDDSSLSGSDIVRVEGILKKDAMYRNSLRKISSSSEKKKRKPVIDVWFSENTRVS